MNRDELIRSVPVYEYQGLRFFICVADIPDPWRAQFLKALFSSQCPAFEGEGDLAYVWDWERWVYGRSYASISSRMD